MWIHSFFRILNPRSINFPKWFLSQYFEEKTFEAKHVPTFKNKITPQPHQKTKIDKHFPNIQTQMLHVWNINLPYIKQIRTYMYINIPYMQHMGNKWNNKTSGIHQPPNELVSPVRSSAASNNCCMGRLHVSWKRWVETVDCWSLG